MSSRKRRGSLGCNEGLGLRQDSILQSWMEAVLCENLDLDAEKLLELQLHTSHVEQRRASGDVHDEVEVGVRARIASGPRTEYPDIGGSVGTRDLEDLLDRQLFHIALTARVPSTLPGVTESARSRPWLGPREGRERTDTQ